jgi:predicted PurR-regulated permease PerM
LNVDATHYERWKLLAVRAWALIGVAVIVASVLWLGAQISRVLTPFILAAIVVFIMRRPVNALERRKIPRGAGVAICYLIGALLLTFFGIFVVPPLVAQFREFLADFPGYLVAARDIWFDLQRQYTNLEIPTWLEDAVLASRVSLAEWAAVISEMVASGVVTLGGQIASLVFNLFLSLALAFFVLRDLPKLKHEILLLGGWKRRDELIEVMGRVTAVVEGWLRGQTMIAFIVGVLTWVGLALLGVPYALIVGLIAGVTNLIPYLGPVVGGIVAAISAAFVSPSLVLWAVLYIIAVQQVESLFLQPRVMSDQVQLHPVVVVFSLLVGASIAGVMGMLLAVPIAGAVSAVFVFYFEKHTDSQLATENGALFRSAGCADSEDDEPCEESDDEDAQDNDAAAGPSDP